MPSSSPGKVRGPVVRQLSLQNPIQSQGHKGLKKQLSEDDTRVLESITGQGWSLYNERSESPKTKVTGTRPKPVKVAWTDRKSESFENPMDVGVVATKCLSQPRPMSVKAQRLKTPLLGNKDTLVYSRLQLAERLRNAWSEREKMKPNINIFLAHGANTTRSEAEQSPERSKEVDVVSSLSDSSAPLDKKRKSMQVRAIFSEDMFGLKEYVIPKEKEESETFTQEKHEEIGRYLQELNKIEIRVTKAEQEGEENQPPDENEEMNNDDLHLSVKRCKSKGKETEEPMKEQPKELPTAQDRRANFRRRSVLNKTISESFLKEEKPEEEQKPLKPTLKKPPLLRAFSAPSSIQDNQKPSQQKKVRIAPLKKLQPTVSFDIPDDTTARDRIKSAPIRRKLKAAAARKSKEKDLSDDEKETKDSKKTTRRQLKNGGEIVTMVSLVSPAASDTEDSVILPIDSFRNEEKEEPQTNRSSTLEADEAKNTTLAVQKFVSLRKTPKSVTFQTHPILNRSYSASFPSRRAPAGTPVIIPTPVISNPALTPAQIHERDKRLSVFAVGAGTDNRGIKRRLLRSSTEPTKEDEEFPHPPKPVSNSKDEQETETTEETEGKPEEPEFKSAKEKECWTLYQKMLQRGVSVSFDTVLRGMLTPTEYRLRKNSLLSTC